MVLMLVLCQPVAILCCSWYRYHVFVGVRNRIWLAEIHFISPRECSFFSIRQHLSYDDCIDDKREDYQNCSVLCCVTQLCTVWYEQLLQMNCFRCRFWCFTRASLFVLILHIFFIWCISCVILWLSVPVQSIEWKLERFVSEMTYHVSSRVLNPRHSRTPCKMILEEYLVMMLMLPICHSQWMWTSPATFIVSAETATCKVLRHWTKLWPTLNKTCLLLTPLQAGWLRSTEFTIHKCGWLVVCLVMSVCLSCLCSNLWKPWPRNFIFGEQAHLDQGRWVKVKVTWAKSHTSVIIIIIIIIIIIQHFYSAYRVRGYRGAGCARLSPCEQMSLEMSLECL